MGGTAIAASKSCDVNVSVSLIKVSSPESGTWEHSITGRKSWSASCSFLVTQIASSAAMVGQKVRLSFAPVSTLEFSGTVANPTLTPGNPPSVGAVLFDTTRKIFVCQYSPAQGVVLYFSNFPGKPPLIRGEFYYNTSVSKCYRWTGSAMVEVKKLVGWAIVKSWKGSFAVNNLAKGSYNFEGVGSLDEPNS